MSCIIYFTDDLSYNKLASQSHTVIGTDYAAGNAVDRNSTTCMRAQAIGHNSPDKTVWWRVDLGRVYSIYSINVIFRTWDGYGTCTSFLFTLSMICTILASYIFLHVVNVKDFMVESRSWRSVQHIQS